MFTLLREQPGDGWEMEALYDLAFGPGRRALSSYQLRRDVAPVAELCMVARDDYGSVAGCIRYWPVMLGDEGAPALLLGPVAVHPTRQGEGIGALLILETMEIATAHGWERAVLVGDEPYYRRFGFTRSAGTALEFPPPTNPERLLAHEFVPGALSGIAGMVGRWQGLPYELSQE